MIKIRKPLCFSEIGRKDNQGDYLYPAKADTDTHVFILCDGMGGHDNGEVASMTAANALGDYLSSCGEIDIPTFETGLAKAYDALDGIDTDSAKKPGTTMTCLCLNDNSYLVAHIGDSRIYHIRPSLFSPKTRRGGILYQSSDHSLVNDLLKAGELTEEEARDFPQKNIITRAMQPHLAKRCKADVYLFDNIEEGDYFFLCCDGILERLSNEDLCAILAEKKIDDQEKLARIKGVCDQGTRDNYTCWLIPVDKVRIKGNSKVTSVIRAAAEIDPEAKVQTDAPHQKLPAKVEAKPKKKVLTLRIPLPSIQKPSGKLILWIVLAIAAIALIIAAPSLLRKWHPSSLPGKTKEATESRRVHKKQHKEIHQIQSLWVCNPQR